jgi:TRAP-type C4-dicarboxylate transport system substrate-binding protein
MRAFTLGSILALTAAAAAGGAARADTTVLKWGEHLPPCCSMYAAAADWMQKEVDARSNGTLKFDINYGGVLATVGEITTAIETGMIDMGNIVTPYFPDELVVNNAIPFFWPQPKSQQELGELMLKWDAEIPEFSEELAKYNAKLITVRPLPPYGLICTTPIRSLEDFEGKRVRSYGVALPAMLSALGAVPVSMADVETYEAMSNNVLDCSAADLALVDAFKLNEIAPYFIEVPMGASWGHIIAMNLDTYNALSDEHKALLEDLKTDHLTEMLRLFREREAELIAQWKTDGSVEIITLDPEAFLEVTLNDPGVQQVRNSWKERAIATGMDPEHADRVVHDITN